jgi:hypothetical protein
VKREGRKGKGRKEGKKRVLFPTILVFSDCLAACLVEMRKEGRKE